MSPFKAFQIDEDARRGLAGHGGFGCIPSSGA